MTFFAFFQNRFMVPICVFLDAKWHLVISLHFKECEFTIFQTKKKIVKIRGEGSKLAAELYQHVGPTRRSRFLTPPRNGRGAKNFFFLILLDFNIL